MRSRRDPTDRAWQTERWADGEDTPEAWQIAADAWEDAGNLDRAERVRDIYGGPIGRVGERQFIPQPVPGYQRRIHDRPLPRQLARSLSRSIREERDEAFRIMQHTPRRVACDIRAILRAEYNDFARWRLIEVLNDRHTDRAVTILFDTADRVRGIPPMLFQDDFNRLKQTERARLKQIIESEIRAAFLEHGQWKPVLRDYE